MIEVKLTFPNVDAALAFLSLRVEQPAAPVSDAPAAEQPAKRGRKARGPATIDMPPGSSAEVVADAGSVTAEVNLAQGSKLTVEVPEVQQAPAPVEASKATQKDLIAAFRALADTKGTAPIVALLTKYGVKSVATIPEAQWGAAILDAQAATK